jgi:hypothetical protein
MALLSRPAGCFDGRTDIRLRRRGELLMGQRSGSPAGPEIIGFRAGV